MSGAGRGGLWSLLASVAWRFLRGRRSRLLDGTARSALAATALGVTVMVIAMALMTGYREDLQHKLLGGNAAVIAYPLSEEGLELPAAAAAELRRLPQVEAVRQVAYGQGSLASAAVAEGLDVTLRGGDPVAAGEKGRLFPAPAPAAAPGEVPAVLLGDELARRLEAAPGEVLRLMVLGIGEGRPRFRYRSVRFAGTFSSGYSDFDRRMAIVDRELLEGLTGSPVGTSFFEFVVADFRRTREVAEQVRELLPDYLVRDWRELSPELFTALRLQQIGLFFVLGLIVLVSTFNVASSLVVLVRERMRDIGVLAALGLAPRHLRAVFLLFGGLLSVIGTSAGVALGSAVAWLLTRFELIRFDPEVAAVYFLSSVPFRVRWPDLLAVVLFTLAVTLVACWLPARRAASIRPATALRYE